MLYLDGFFGIALFGLWIFCIVDVITTGEGACRNLPKLGWLAIVILLPEVGSIAWLIAGRPWPGMSTNRLIPPTPGYAEYERLGRATASSPESDEEFLRQCRARAEEQRRRYQERSGES